MWKRFNTEFWLAKFARNVKRDRENICELSKLGWKVVVVWECELLKNPEEVLAEIAGKLAEYAEIHGNKPAVQYVLSEPEDIPHAAESPAEYAGKK